MTDCTGSGRTWGSGTGTPVCRVCRRGPSALGAKQPIRRQRVVGTERTAWTGKVPTHEERTR